MGFPSDGRNHYNGINSEKKISKFKEELENYYGFEILDILLLGGTKNKTDYKILFKNGEHSNQSLKSKKNIKIGSFDYVNTSSFDAERLLPKTYEIYSKYRGSKNILNYNKLTSSISEEIKKGITSNDLTKFFLNHVVKKYDDYKLSLTIEDQNTGNIYINVIPKVFDFVRGGGKLIIRDTGKKSMSYKVDGIDNEGNLIKDFNLRLRIHLNNGKTKWLNDESSILVMKFQQDSVNKLIN